MSIAQQYTTLKSIKHYINRMNDFMIININFSLYMNDKILHLAMLKLGYTSADIDPVH